MSPSPYSPGPGLEEAGGQRGGLGAAQASQLLLNSRAVMNRFHL